MGSAGPGLDNCKASCPEDSDCREEKGMPQMIGKRVELRVPEPILISLA